MQLVQAPSWGNLPGDSGSLSIDLRSFVGAENVLIRGMGRSYGDVCTNSTGKLLATKFLNKFLRFEPETGILTCEAGVTISEIQRMFVHRGWMVPVTPGTQFVSVGGAIANDVHGKNHHSMGTFGEHVLSLNLLRTNGELLSCSKQENPELFHATIGGLGLTGFIVQATIQLQSVPGPWLQTENLIFGDVDEFLAISDDTEDKWKYSVSWIDCAKASSTRGIFMRGNPVAAENRKEPQPRNLNFPFTPPISVVNKLSVKVFNQAYFKLNAIKKGTRVTHYQPFFYPLDAVQNWNRMYGRNGFYQHQCVVPRVDGEGVLREILQVIQKSGQGSFLSVLKTFGDREPAGLLSFTRAGITLALDFPNHGESTLKLLEALDGIVISAGGAINPSKDARMSRETFEASFPRSFEFQQFRDRGISSDLSKRLMGS